MGELLRAFSRQAWDDGKRYGQQKVIMVEYDAKYEDLVVQVWPDFQIGRPRNLVYQDLYYLATTLTFYFHQVDDWPSCMSLWDPSQEKTADNRLAFAYIGATVPRDLNGALCRSATGNQNVTLSR